MFFFCLLGNAHSDQIFCDINKIAKSSGVSFTRYFTQGGRIISTSNVKTGNISGPINGVVSCEKYKIVCKNSIVSVEVSYCINGKDVLIKKYKTNLIKYYELWNKISEQDVLNLKNPKKLEDIKSENELKTVFNDLKRQSLHEFSFYEGNKTNCLVVEYIYDLVDQRYARILKEIWKYLNLGNDELSE